MALVTNSSHSRTRTGTDELAAFCAFASACSQETERRGTQKRQEHFSKGMLNRPHFFLETSVQERSPPQQSNSSKKATLAIDQSSIGELQAAAVVVVFALYWYAYLSPIYCIPWPCIYYFGLSSPDSSAFGMRSYTSMIIDYVIALTL